ncbi:ferredoxin [Actinocorallia libanotica]|uniref:Ferredoxin n=1 Tax=Actinocorallia libanotica TaxID=46162 RepID=A0ABN1R719_9ACTN
MRVSADRESCISAGRCMAATSEVFDQDEDGLVLVLVAEPAGEQRAHVRKAAYSCPAGAIEIRSDDV